MMATRSRHYIVIFVGLWCGKPRPMLYDSAATTAVDAAKMCRHDCRDTGRACSHAVALPILSDPEKARKKLAFYEKNFPEWFPELVRVCTQ